MADVLLYIEGILSWIPEPFNHVYLGFVSLFICTSTVGTVTGLWSIFKGKR